MQTQGVPNSPFQGLSEYTHIPLPPEHSVGTNEATTAPTPENPQSWQLTHRPREIFGHRVSGIWGCGAYTVCCRVFYCYHRVCHRVRWSEGTRKTAGQLGCRSEPRGLLHTHPAHSQIEMGSLYEPCGSSSWARMCGGRTGEEYGGGQVSIANPDISPPLWSGCCHVHARMTD